MGEVYRARDPRLGRCVAIKLSVEHFSERFEQEARAVAALNHPHICQVYDVGLNYLVMELIEGTPLKGPFPLDQALKYAAQICDALDAAHKRGITHRDLKPANILVNKAGVKLLDFGLAKMKPTVKADNATLTMTLTGKNEILGTLYYMSPEQLQAQGQDTDARSDLFSFGLVLYEMVTGKRAFEGASRASVVAAILERPAPSIATVAPPALDRVLQRCLAKDPEDRWQSARDLKAALAWTLEESRPPAARSSRRWWIAAAAAIVFSAVGSWTIAHVRQPVADDRLLRFPLNLPEGGQIILGTNRGGIALSPDGKTAVLVANVKGKVGLWVLPLDGTVPRLIPGTESAAYPFWSPDGQALAFHAEAGSKLERVDVMGGGLLTICDVPALARGGIWLQDGQIIFGTLGGGLFRVSASGGTPSPLTNLDTSRGEVGHGWPQALPHGRVMYWVQSNQPEISGVYVTSLAKPGEHVRLFTTNENAIYAPGAGRDHLLWLRGTTLVAQDFDPGTLKLSGELYTLAEPVTSTIAGHLNASVSPVGLLLYSASRTLSQFTWMDRSGKRLAAVSAAGEYTTFRLSPNGRRAAVGLSGVGGSDLWILELERGVATRFTSRPSDNNLFPVWAPDGATILFQRSSGSMFRHEASGAGNDQRISQSTNTLGPLDWSRDGRSMLYFEIAPGTNRDLWILPVTADGKPAQDAKSRPYLRTPFSEWYGRFSPEPSPRWVAYQSNESGRYEVYVDSFPEPRNKIRISKDGGQYPQWGLGGRELFYVSPDCKLMSISLKLGTDSVEPGTPRELFPLPANDDGLSSPYDVGPDGQRFLVRATPQQEAAQALTVIVNWPALLKKGAAAH